MATTFQPVLLYPHSASAQPLVIANGRGFTLRELYDLLHCQTVQVVRLTPELILIIDEEGKFRQPAYLNLLATAQWHQYQPEARGRDCIVGRAVLCHTSQFE